MVVVTEGGGGGVGMVVAWLSLQVAAGSTVRRGEGLVG